MDVIKKYITLLAFLRHIHFTHATVLVVGTLCIFFAFGAILFWDITLFTRSFSRQNESTITAKQILLNAKDIDDAIMILNRRQQQLNALIPANGTSTVVF